jgi:hypothetical protein
MQTDTRDEVIRRQVTEILERSAAFCSLPPERRREVARRRQRLLATRVLLGIQRIVDCED